MALKLDYIARETGQNLRRNVTLTLAAVLTVAVSLTLVGTALLVRQAVQNAFNEWEGGIEFIVYMNAGATQEQLDGIERVLDSDVQVDEFRFVDQPESFEEFQELFSDSPAILESVRPEDLPPSFRVVPKNPDAEVVSAYGEKFEDDPGVRQVVFAAEQIRAIQRLANALSSSVLAAAIALLFAALLLILNSIRIAMFARRREIEVMKLVGATNTFIRIPFVLEGTVHGVLGAVVGIGGLQLVNNLFQRIAEDDQLQLLKGFAVASGELRGIQLFVIVVGVAVGAIGSGIAAGRFLDV